MTQLRVNNYFNVTHFASLIRQIGISNNDGLRLLLKLQSKLRRLKKIKIRCIKVAPVDVDRMKDILSKIEFLCLDHTDLTKNFGYCTNLKRLELERCDIDCERLIQNYLSLEYFSFRPKKWMGIKGLEKILEFNPNIRKFATEAECLWENREAMNHATNINLNDLAIVFHDNVDVELFASHCNLLNEFHERGVYKRLHLYIWEIPNQEVIDRLLAVNGLVKLFFRFASKDVALSTLNRLEELNARDSDVIAHLEAAANNLIKLKRIQFDNVRLNDIVPFVKRSVCLKKNWGQLSSR